jgi:hypothetical protein
MSQTPKPIKRSVQLAPLSREHHEGLLLAWKIRQGIRFGIEENRIAAYVQWFWQTHLQLHFKKEEDLLPVVLPPAHHLFRQMLQEHTVIKNEIEAIRHGDLKKFETLAQHLTDHIRFEERQLFEEVEKTASPDQLEQIAQQLNDEESKADWPDAFWIKM